MNSAIHSGLNSGRITIMRRSKAYRQRIFKRLLFGFPIVATIGWEYRVWKRKLYYTRNRGHFHNRMGVPCVEAKVILYPQPGPLPRLNAVLWENVGIRIRLHDRNVAE